MERFDAGCLTDAKKEYTQRFVRKLKTPFCNKILEMFKEAQEECANSHEEDKVLLFFQAKLEKVHEWEDTNIQMFSRTIISQSKCDYLEELLQGVFIVHTKVLAVIQHHKSTTKSELNTGESHGIPLLYIKLLLTLPELFGNLHTFFLNQKILANIKKIQTLLKRKLKPVF